MIENVGFWSSELVYANVNHDYGIRTGDEVEVIAGSLAGVKGVVTSIGDSGDELFILTVGSENLVCWSLIAHVTFIIFHLRKYWQEMRRRIRLQLSQATLHQCDTILINALSAVVLSPQIGDTSIITVLFGIR